MRRIAREIPGLAGKLSAPRVTYVKSLKKTYITFESSVLAGEKEFLRLERILRECFPGRALAVRVVSPGLRDSFLTDIGAYRSVLTDFLRRNYPGIVAWLPEIDWQCKGDRVTLTFPDEFSLDYVGRYNIANRLAIAISDISIASVCISSAAIFCATIARHFTSSSDRSWAGSPVICLIFQSFCITVQKTLPYRL